MDRAQFWDARLTQHLEGRSENWSEELSILEGQRVNPFELNRAQMDALIESRRQLLGI